MQLILNGGSTGTHEVTTSPVVYPITTPAFAYGIVDAGALVEVDAGMVAALQAKLMYRTFATDDSQSAGSWVAIGTAQQGPGKTFKSGAVTATGLRIQLGVELSTTTGTTVGRARLLYPILVTK